MSAQPRLTWPGLTRRGFLKGSALVVSFSLFPGRGEAQGTSGKPAGPPFGDLKKHPYLDSWIGIDAKGGVTVYSGKAELGQGIKTALMQCATEQLAVGPEAITMVMASTSRTPDEGYTAGSNSMMMGGTAILHAASQLRNILLDWAAADLGADRATLKAEKGRIVAPDGRSLGYGALVKGRSLHVRATDQSALIPPGRYRIIGRSIPRIDIPAKLTGGAAYVQDIRFDGMLHARVVRPPNYGATLKSLDSAPVEWLPGVVKVVREGSYLAVAAKGEFQAIIAMRALQQAAQWEVPQALPEQSTIPALLRRLPSKDQLIDSKGVPPGGGMMEAVYTRPYMMHGAIGPSCAVALFDRARLTVWTHSQGVYPLRKSIAAMLAMPEAMVECIHAEGSGCYGHNGADDAAADAAIIARALPGRPVRVQWMREDEHGWEPYGSPMIAQARAALDAGGMIASWDYELWSMPHATRPAGSPNNLMPAWYLPQRAGPPQGSEIPLPSGGGDRNAIPTYTLPESRIVYHLVPEMPLRVSALRSLGGYLNVFAIESFMDELALAARADPVAFRLRHLQDHRAKDVIRLAAGKFGWTPARRLPPLHGRGFAFVRYETIKAYCAVAVEIVVDAESGQIRVKRAVAAVDSGDAVSPDGIENQIQGCIIQATSWTLYESVAFSRTEITSRDWGSYPILRFDAVPDSVDVHVVNRPGTPFLGTGEAGMGPTPAAIANALADATGLRLRDLPLSAETVRRAMLGGSAG